MTLPDAASELSEEIISRHDRKIMVILGNTGLGNVNQQKKAIIF